VSYVWLAGTCRIFHLPVRDMSFVLIAVIGRLRLPPEKMAASIASAKSVKYFVRALKSCTTNTPQHFCSINNKINMNCNKCGTALTGEASITFGYPSRAAYVSTIFHCAKEDIYWLQQLDTTDWLKGRNPMEVSVPCVMPPCSFH